MPARTLRLLALSSTALCVIALGQPAAASCTADTDGDGNPTLSCDGAVTERLRNDVDDLTLTFTPSGSIIVPNNDALDLRGNGQTVINQGRVSGEREVVLDAEGEVIDDGSNGIRARGSDLTVDNSGIIAGTDRGIRLSGGDGGFTLLNRETGEILSRRQAVRLDQDALLAGNRFENWGLIDSSEGRAIQSRGSGNVVINHATGRMIGGEEVIEGRMDFHVENRGLIALSGLSWDPATMSWSNSGAVSDEDGIQFASGSVENLGVILATDDGIDMDEGRVHNHASGVIVSAGPDDTRSSAGVDIDDVLQDPGGPRDGEIPGPVTVINDGYIEGPTGIAASLDATHPVEIFNSGTLIGRGGNAIDLAPGQGDSTIALFGTSAIEGDVLFGAGGVNTLILGPFETGARFAGKVAVRGLGEEPGVFDVAFASGVGIGDFYGLLFGDDRIALGLRAGTDRLRLDLFGAARFALDGVHYAPDDFAALMRASGVGTIPLPAGIWLLLGGLGLLAGLTRARRAA